jgi:diguanylate cyclase (GGDEF)-like protein/PAS domain S-box-containing protein
MDLQALFDDLPASLYAGNPDAIAVYDRDGRLVACNDAALHLSGAANREELLGTHIGMHVHRNDAARAEQAFSGALAGRTQHVETTIRHGSGTIVPVEVYLFPARVNGAIAGVFAQGRDRVALREAERAIALNQERFRSLFEYHPDAIMALRCDGRISRVNVGLEAATGYYGEQLINKPWTEIIAPECREQAEKAFGLAARGETTEFDSFVIDRLGNRIDVQMNLVPLRAGETIEGAYAIAKNVVAQRSAERVIAEQSERIRELYLVAAAQGEPEEQIEKTIALGCRLFGFDYGYVTRFDDVTISILNAVGDGAGIRAGSVYPKERALSRLVAGDAQMIFIPDLDEPPWNDDPARFTAPWRSYFATKLKVRNRDFGALVFAARHPHDPVPDTDRDLIQLMSLFVAAALERAQHAERMEQLAFFDALTGLPNRVLFDDRIKQTMGAAKRYKRGFAIMYLDLDDFKTINDRFGHLAGDLVLKAVAERLLMALRESDTVARFGGDEFVILQPVVNGAGDAADLAKRIVSSMQAPFDVNGADYIVHTSVGIALYPRDGLTAEELMDRADRALYRAKRAGRNRWEFFNDGAALKEWPAL